MRKAPRPSIRWVPAGTRTLAAGPIAIIRRPSVTTAWSGAEGAPVIAITVTWTMATGAGVGPERDWALSAWPRNTREARSGITWIGHIAVRFLL